MNKKQPDSKRSIIYLMRHGDSRQDEVKRFIGQTDTPLNEPGRKQAAWWCEEFYHFFSTGFTAVTSADLLKRLK